MTKLVECWMCGGTGLIDLNLEDDAGLPGEKVACDECGGSGYYEDETTDCPDGYCEMCRSGVKCY